MGLDAKKFLKLQKKVEKRLIGTYGSSKGLGQDLVVKKYSYETNEYGDKENITFISEVNVKGIVVTSDDFNVIETPGLRQAEQVTRLYIPVNTEVEDTETITYEFLFGSKTYLLDQKNDIGQVANITGVVREIMLKLKPL